MTKYFSQDSQQWRKKVFFFYIFDNLTGESRVENQKNYFQYNQPDLYIMSTSQNKKRVLNQISALSLLQQKNVTLKGHDERGFSLCVKDRRPTDGLVGKQGAFKISTEGFFLFNSRLNETSQKNSSGKGGHCTTLGIRTVSTRLTLKIATLAPVFSTPCYNP